jgi:nucleoside-diphosphate-sugar epimerase
MQPSYVVVTGVADFIDSHPARRVSDEGRLVGGIDDLAAAVSTQTQLANLDDGQRLDLGPEQLLPSTAAD